MNPVRLYARVSTADQSTDAQINDLRNLAGQRGWDIEDEYVDVISGARDKRPGLDRLIAEMRAGEVVAVTKLDRLARSLPHLLDLSKTFKTRGVNLVVKDNAEIDTTTPTGNLVFSVLGAVASFERDLVVSRTRQGLRLAKLRLQSEGRNLGRPPRTIPTQMLLDLNGSGASLGEMSRKLKASKNTVKKWLASIDVSKPGPKV